MVVPEPNEQLLEHEPGEHLRVGRRKQDAVGAGRLQVAIGPLHADGAAQHAQRRHNRQVLRLQARLVCRLQEGGADHHDRHGIHFVVLVVGGPEP